MQVNRRQASVELVIDDVYSRSVTTPGPLHQLNVRKGVYLGLTLSTHDVFFGHFDAYRGCLQDVTFNDVDVLEMSRSSYSFEAQYFHSVTWECSAEFAATSDQPISFLTNTSFIEFPPLQTQAEVVRVTFDLRTRTDRCLLFYFAGAAYDSDYLVAELLDGQLVLSVNRGNGQTDFLSAHNVADGAWHQIDVIIDPQNIRVGVDGASEERSMRSGRSHFLNLDGLLFVGGLDHATRMRVLQHHTAAFGGVRSAHASLVGCLHNFKVDGESLGFREAQVTRGLHAECVWTYPCSSEPCVEGAECEEDGFYHYTCSCAQDDCYRLRHDAPVTVPLTNVLQVQDLIVREGETALVTATNINVLTDYTAHGLRDHDVIFSVITPPKHGCVRLLSGLGATLDDDVTSFTQDDLLRNRVVFEHDDSESNVDSIELQLDFRARDVIHEQLPDKLQQSYNFALVVQVAPWNDKPVLALPPNDTLVVVENTFVNVTSSILSVRDDDDAASRLNYSIQYNSANSGYFELSDSRGTRARIHAFTQADIDAGHVRFVHRGASAQEFRLQVSDGKDFSRRRVLRVRAVPLRLRVKTNTGIDIVAASNTLITRAHLQYDTNAPNQDIAVRFDVTDPPYYGELQKLHSAGRWRPVTRFTQDDVDDARIRYAHNNTLDNPGDDYFRFRVLAMDETTPESEFYVRVTPVRVELEVNRKLMMYGVREEGITNEQLRAVSTLPTHSSRDVIFALTRAPTRGSLWLQDAGDKLELSGDATFTQHDVDTGKLTYRLLGATQEVIDDEFRFRLSVHGIVSSEIFFFLIQYNPSSSGAVYVNNGLYVNEGQRQTITRDDLLIEMPEVRDYLFSVTWQPQHGVLQLVNPNTRLVRRSNITEFANSDIRQRRLVYKHDDSETVHDSFEFAARPVGPAQFAENTFNDRFVIEIAPENDNAPVRVVHSIVEVVVNGGRLLTGNDIKFLDPDSDYDSGSLLYIVDSVENGHIVRASNHDEHLLNFTQAQLEAGHVFFKHAGARFGRSTLRVSDGRHEANGTLEVHAREAYVHVISSDVLQVLRGGAVLLSAMNLSLDSNLLVSESDIRFEVVVPPQHGNVVREDGGFRLPHFNMADIKSGSIMYQHDNSDSLEDDFNVRIVIGNAHIEHQVRVRVRSSADSPHRQTPPIVDTNRPLIVDHLGTNTISRRVLRVTHPDTPPRDLTFTIKRWPKHGSVTLSRGEQPAGRLLRFTQHNINRGELTYTHERDDAARDAFTFDVSNGIMALSGVTFVIQTIPLMIALNVSNLTVAEGGRIPLDEQVLSVSDAFEELLGELRFLVMRQPTSGWLVDATATHANVTQFSQQVLAEGRIYYKHDGNDTTYDEFTVLVVSTTSGKQSSPQTVQVRVLPDNDEPPQVSEKWLSDKQMWPSLLPHSNRAGIRRFFSQQLPRQISLLTK